MYSVMSHNKAGSITKHGRECEVRTRYNEIARNIVGLPCDTEKITR